MLAYIWIFSAWIRLNRQAVKCVEVGVSTIPDCFPSSMDGMVYSISWAVLNADADAFGDHTKETDWEGDVTI